MSACLLGLMAAMLSVVAIAQDNSEQQRPQVSIKPFKMMSQLSGLKGIWDLQTLYSDDGGDNWKDMGSVPIEIGFDQKDLMLYERPLEPNMKGFNMVSYITYDQYRKVFRKAAIDDVWGIMDIYTGNIENDKLVLTNLDSGTVFPEKDGRSRGFRLTLELKGNIRTMTIDATLDEGKTWQPNFKNIYSKRVK